MSDFGVAINSIANTLRRKRSEPRTMAKLFTMAPKVLEVELAAARALTVMDGLVRENAVRRPFPGFDQALKSLRHISEQHRDDLDSCRICGDQPRGRG